MKYCLFIFILIHKVVKFSSLQIVQLVLLFELLGYFFQPGLLLNQFVELCFWILLSLHLW